MIEDWPPEKFELWVAFFHVRDDKLKAANRRSGARTPGQPRRG